MPPPELFPGEGGNGSFLNQAKFKLDTSSINMAKCVSAAVVGRKTDSIPPQKKSPCCWFWVPGCISSRRFCGGSSSGLNKNPKSLMGGWWPPHSWVRDWLPPPTRPFRWLCSPFLIFGQRASSSSNQFEETQSHNRFASCQCWNFAMCLTRYFAVSICLLKNPNFCSAVAEWRRESSIIIQKVI